MKHPLWLVIFALTIFSCRRNVDQVVPDSLEGTWRMVSVKNKSTGLFTTKPASITGEVEITFVAIDPSKGFFSGVTPTNAFYGDYSLPDENRITIPVIGASEVIETSWGLEFLYNAHTAQSYAFEAGNKLSVHTPEKVLYFKRQ